MKQFLIPIILTSLLIITGCDTNVAKSSNNSVKSSNNTQQQQPKQFQEIHPQVNGKALRFQTEDKNAPVIYFTKDMSAQGLLKVYKALQQEKKGKVAIKVSFGGADEQYLNPQLLTALVKETEGTFGETCGFTPPRDKPEGNLAMAKEHGFTKVGKVDIWDKDGDVDMPVKGGYHLKYARTGAHINNYDTFIAVHRFKLHNIPRLGGNIKNISLAMGSLSGHAIIHSAGKNEKNYENGDKDVTSQCFADAAKAALDYKPGRWAFINVVDSFKPVDKCQDTHNVGDIGIMASLDPVAIDQASVDFVAGAAKDDKTREQWEDFHSVNTLAYAEKINVGKRHYRLISVD